MAGNNTKMMSHLALTHDIPRKRKKNKTKVSRFFKGRKAVKFILPTLNL